MSKQITINDVSISDSWIHVKGVGTIGLYHKGEHFIGLDYSMKWIVGTNDCIPCSYDEIKEKVVNLFNK